MPEDSPLSAYSPSHGGSLPPHRSAELASLIAEARTLNAQKEANEAEIGRLSSANAAIHDRLNRIDALIRVSLWDGNPIR